VSAPLLRTRAELAAHLARLRATGAVRRVVLANGCFDLVHVGHARYLAEARARGDCLVVALNTDESVRGLKGPGRPLVTLEERAEVVAALRCVDFVTSFGEPTLEATLRALRPDVHAKGTDYTKASVPEAAIDAELGIEIAICGDAKTRSSSALAVELARTSSASPAAVPSSASPRAEPSTASRSAEPPTVEPPAVEPPAVEPTTAEPTTAEPTTADTTA